MGVGAVLAAWGLDPVPTAGIGLAALAYLAAWWRLSRAGVGWPAGRAALFGAGLLALVVAVDGPPDALAEESFSMHMAQHLLIMMVAAPLLVLAGPVWLVLRADPRWLPRSVLAPVVRSRPARVLTHPLLAFGLLAMVLVLSHLSGFYEAALESPRVHEAEHIAYLAAAVLFWSTTIGSEPIGRPLSAPARMFLLLLMMPVMALLGLAIAEADQLLYPYYGDNPPPWGATPMADQHLAGTLMWTVGMIIMPVPLAVLLRRWFDEDERAHARLTARQFRDAAS
ncbi:MAG TPA: cytochrome c oxidase assembly protein [Micromonosporaceae bacterium]|jgi:putative copper resistance protein D